MKSNGYISATKICITYGKHFRHLVQNAATKNIINQFLVAKLTASLCNQQHFILVKGKRGTSACEIRCTYIHPDLIKTVLAWVSPSHALLANKITNRIAVEFMHSTNITTHCTPLALPPTPQLLLTASVTSDKPKTSHIVIIQKNLQEEEYPCIYYNFNCDKKGYTKMKKQVLQRSKKRYPDNVILHKLVNVHTDNFTKHLNSFIVKNKHIKCDHADILNIIHNF